MSHKITALIGTRNEEAKIATCVTHCLKWADDIVLVDKSSTDRTCEIAANLGARIVSVPFTRQGHESVAEQAAAAYHDWVWIWTSHEVPTRSLINYGKALIERDGHFLELVRVPMFYYSFGVHHDQSPWAGGWQPRLFNRKKVTFTGIAHDPIKARFVTTIPMLRAGEDTSILPVTDECDSIKPKPIFAKGPLHVLHQTHAPVDRFMISHCDYMVNEAANGDPLEVFQRAMHTASRFDPVFQANAELLGQALGWKIYWFGVALHALERSKPSVVEEYAARCAAALKEWQ